MAGDAPMWLASMLAIAGVAVLRVSWGRAKRSLPLNLSGWAALITALVVADSAAGEWGVTIAILVATGAAFVALAFAAVKPVRKVKAKAVRTVHRGADENAAARRSGWLTFLITGPLSLGASILLALAMRALIVMAGGAEADGNVAVLAVVPIAWPIFAFALLMMSRRRVQLAWVFGVAALCAPFLMFQGGPA
tara:strand:- start:698 stop:1276 length:579 start_codon:yes stop_codon:yes gene_type:complete